MSKQRLPTLFNFSELYFKLSYQSFTTIRSINHKAKRQNYDGSKEEFQIIEGMRGWISLKGKALKIVKVVEFQDLKICDIPLEILKKDVEYPNFIIQTKEDFVNGLNEITRKAGYAYANNRLTTVKRIFYLKCIGGRSEEW